MPLNSKIIIRVVGGLGNQLFIYAFARSVSLKYNLPVFLETRTGFVKDSFKRKYLLNHFNIRLKPCLLIDSLYFPLNKRFPNLTRVIYGNVMYFNEHNLRMDSIGKILRSYKKIYFDGYWQKEENFKEYRDIILDELSVRFEISQENKDLSSEIKNCNSVGVHLRRVQYNNLLDLDYYYNAIRKIKGIIDKPMFYVFSDDIKWCKENIRTSCELNYIDHNQDDEISELWLMSQCRHFIIANSTFSWWGAWLSSYSEKIIVKPNN
jgi:hypothetical protein